MQLLVHVRISTVIDLGAEKLWSNKVLFHGILNNFCVGSTGTVHLFIKLFLACHLICNIKLPLFLKTLWNSGHMENNLGHVTMSWWWSLHVSVIPRAGSLGPWPLLHSAMSHWSKLERLNTTLPRPSRTGLSMGPIIPDPPHRKRSWSWKPGTFSFLVSWPYSCISAALWWPLVECNIDIHVAILFQFVLKLCLF